MAAQNSRMVAALPHRSFHGGLVQLPREKYPAAGGENGSFCRGMRWSLCCGELYLAAQKLSTPGRADPVRLHPRTEHLRNHHAAVFLLKLFQDRDDGAADREGRAVQGVDQPDLLGFVPITDLGASRLVVAEVRAA